MMLFRLLFTLCSLLVTYHLTFGQVEDSIVIRNDTAYIIKKPVVITKKVYVTSPKPVVKKAYHFFVTPYIQTSYSLDYITVCNLQRGYYDQIDEATAPRLNYTIGGMFMLRKTRYIFAVDIGYTTYRERFNRKETNTLNKHQVLTASLDVGYTFLKNENPFEIILVLGAGYLRTLAFSGNTLDKNDHSNIITLTEQNTYDQSSLIANGKILGTYQLDENKSLFFGPTYSTNVLSITRESIPFGEWRHNLGLILGLAVGL
ncbi:MAG: hypothetical protein AAGI07_12160 [Bacteroidota bacterium]